LNDDLQLQALLQAGSPRSQRDLPRGTGHQPPADQRLTAHADRPGVDQDPDLSQERHRARLDLLAHVPRHRRQGPHHGEFPAAQTRRARSPQGRDRTARRRGPIPAEALAGWLGPERNAVPRKATANQTPAQVQEIVAPRAATVRRTRLLRRWLGVANWRTGPPLCHNVQSCSTLGMHP
jgi:hypothetical protein